MARMAALLAGLPQSVPGATVNRLCASGLEAVNSRRPRGEARRGRPLPCRRRRVDEPRALGDRASPSGACRAGRRRCRTPRSAGGCQPADGRARRLDRVDGRDGRERRRALRRQPRGPGRLRLRSHQRAVAAAEQGLFAEEIVPIEAPKGRETDRRGRRGAARGRVAGEARGAAARLPRGWHRHRRQRLDPQRRRRLHAVASEAGGEELGAEPLARVVAVGVAGVDPAFMGIGRSGRAARPSPPRAIGIEDIDLIELNEAFAAQVLACVARARPRRGAPQRQRRRDRPRPPARLLRRPPADHPGSRAPPPRRPHRRRHPMRRRRPGPGDRVRGRLGPAVTGDRFDVVVVGARCAGSPLATMLARAGLSVCVLDRASFPSDTPSTHGIQPCGVEVLGRLGLLPALLERSRPIDHGLLAFNELRIEVGPLSELAGAPMLNAAKGDARRAPARRRRSAGVEVRTGTAVTGLLRSAGRVAGVETSTGPVEARPGRRRRRRPLDHGAPARRGRIPPQPGRRSSSSGPTSRGSTRRDGRVWLGQMGGRAYLASPTDDGLFLAAVVEPIDGTPKLRARSDRRLRRMGSRAGRSCGSGSTARRGSGRSGDVPLARVLPRGGRARAGPWSATPATSRTPRRDRGSPTRCGRRRRWSRRSSRRLGGSSRARRGAARVVGLARPRRLGDVLVRPGHGRPPTTPRSWTRNPAAAAGDPELTEGFVRVLNHGSRPRS